MRRCRSFLATTRSAPSSTFLRPIFQASATRIENCSMLSGSVVGTIRTAIWLPLRVSRSFSVLVSAVMSALVSVPVWSTTRPVSGGTATSAAARLAQHIMSATRTTRAAVMAIRPRSGSFRRRRIEIDLRRRRDLLLVLDREIRLVLVAERHRGQVVREGPDADVIVLHRLDVAVARHRDAVLGAFELRHQVVKQRIGFQLRIILGHHQQSRQRTGELALRSLEFL